MTALFRDHPDLSGLNGGALRDPRVTILNTDAWRFAEDSTEVFDVIIINLPDPKNLSLSKLYSRQFYGALVERLSVQGVMVTQSGSPLFALLVDQRHARCQPQSESPRTGAIYACLPCLSAKLWRLGVCHGQSNAA